MSSVIVEWQQYFRYCCFPFAPVFLEVSNDGGTTWTTFEAKGNFIESANTLSANPLNTSVIFHVQLLDKPMFKFALLTSKRQKQETVTHITSGASMMFLSMRIQFLAT